MQFPAETAEGPPPAFFTHDSMMKQAALRGASGQIQGVSALLVDESQDMNPCQIEWLASHRDKMQVFFVGDAAQTIYAFRGAKSSSLMGLRDVQELPLTQTFRFGPQIGAVANTVLFIKEHSRQTRTDKPTWDPYRLRSKPDVPSIVRYAEDHPEQLPGLEPLCVIARSNMQLMQYAVPILCAATTGAVVATVDSAAACNPALNGGDGGGGSGVGRGGGGGGRSGDNVAADAGAVGGAGAAAEMDSCAQPRQSSLSPIDFSAKYAQYSDDEDDQTAPVPIRAAHPHALPTLPAPRSRSRSITPTARQLPKIAINGKGVASGRAKWATVFNQVRFFFEVYTGQASKIPIKDWADYNERGLDWETVKGVVEEREWQKYDMHLSMIDVYGNSTMEMVRLFKTEILQKCYSNEEADIILTTTHAAKGMEFDHVLMLDEFCNLSEYHFEDATARGGMGAEFAHSNMSKAKRDDLHLWYVAITRAKLSLTLPASFSKFIAELDSIARHAHPGAWDDGTEAATQALQTTQDEAIEAATRAVEAAVAAEAPEAIMQIAQGDEIEAATRAAEAAEAIMQTALDAEIEAATRAAEAAAAAAEAEVSPTQAMATTQEVKLNGGSGGFSAAVFGGCVGSVGGCGGSGYNGAGDPAGPVVTVDGVERALTRRQSEAMYDQVYKPWARETNQSLASVPAEADGSHVKDAVFRLLLE